MTKTTEERKMGTIPREIKNTCARNYRGRGEITWAKLVDFAWNTFRIFLGEKWEN